MDPQKRQRSHTIASNGRGLNTELKKSSVSVSKDANPINRTSLPPGTNKNLFHLKFVFINSESPSTLAGKSWMKLFSGHHIKQ
jgi:hypothetical protein